MYSHSSFLYNGGLLTIISDLMLCRVFVFINRTFMCVCVRVCAVDTFHPSVMLFCIGKLLPCGARMLSKPRSLLCNYTAPTVTAALSSWATTGAWVATQGAGETSAPSQWKREDKKGGDTEGVEGHRYGNRGRRERSVMWRDGVMEGSRVRPRGREREGMMGARLGF